MKAAILREVGAPLSVEPISVDNPRAGEVRIRTAAAGVCHSDLHAIEGTMLMSPLPTALGHESAGIVEAVGDGVHYVKPGDHVVTCLSVFCGHCEACLTGRAFSCMTDESARGPGDPPRLSQDGEVIHQFINLSSFADQLLIGQNALVKIRDDMPLDKAALLGCGVTTGLGAVFNTAKVTPGSSVAVVGAGGVGLAAIQGARIAGAARIVAVDVVGHKLELARELGATDVVDASSTDPVEAVRQLTGGGVEFGFEAIGLPQTVRQMFDMTRGGGTATVIGILPPMADIPMTGVDFMSSKRFQSSMMGGGSFRVEVPRYVELCLQGQLRLDEMVSATLPLEKINDAFDAMKAGEVARSVVVF